MSKRVSEWVSEQGVGRWVVVDLELTGQHVWRGKVAPGYLLPCLLHSASYCCLLLSISLTLNLLQLPLSLPTSLSHHLFSTSITLILSYSQPLTLILTYFQIHLLPTSCLFILTQALPSFTHRINLTYRAYYPILLSVSVSRRPHLSPYTSTFILPLLLLTYFLFSFLSVLIFSSFQQSFFVTPSLLSPLVWWWWWVVMVCDSGESWC